MVWLMFLHPHCSWWFCFPWALVGRMADVQERGCTGGRSPGQHIRPLPEDLQCAQQEWGNGLVWTLLEVFQVCDPVLVCVGLVLVQFQHWLNLQRQMRRRELAWKHTGECSPERSAFLIQAWATTERDSPAGLLPALGQEQGVFGQGVGTEQGSAGWGEGKGRALSGPTWCKPIMTLHPWIPAAGSLSAWLDDNSASTEKCHQAFTLKSIRVAFSCALYLLNGGKLESPHFSQAETETPIYYLEKKRLNGVCRAEIR